MFSNPEVQHRPDLAERSEIKFVFYDTDRRTLEDLLLKQGKRIQYAGSDSSVTSLYFDCPRLSCFTRHVGGAGLRHKSRIRWYDEGVNPSELWFETKWRRHHVMGKERTKLSVEQPLSQSSFKQIHRSLLQALPTDRQQHLSNESDAVVLIKYRRRHYKLDQSRFTIDDQLCFYPQQEWTRLRMRHPYRLPKVSLIECKFAVGAIATLAGALAPLRVRSTGFSKYITACQHLGYAVNDEPLAC